MKTATMSELRTNSAALLRLLAAGEEITITCRGKKVAQLIAVEPETPKVKKKFDWKKSAAFAIDKSQFKMPTKEEYADIFRESNGPWAA